MVGLLRFTAIMGPLSPAFDLITFGVLLLAFPSIGPMLGFAVPSWPLLLVLAAIVAACLAATELLKGLTATSSRRGAYRADGAAAGRKARNAHRRGVT